jgi:methylated-DNA-[protein]-cysteine S-methyltransferase
MKNFRKIPVKTIWGVFYLFVTAKGLCGVRFPEGTGFFFEKRDRRKKFLAPLLNKFRVVKLDLSGCTAFEKKVYQMLCRVPAGRVISYGELARRAGYPGAARAVGTAMKKNRLPIVVPCHRVICSDGSLGQYSQGVHWKRCLLKYEGYRFI